MRASEWRGVCFMVSNSNSNLISKRAQSSGGTALVAIDHCVRGLRFRLSRRRAGSVLGVERVFYTAP